ncbi:ferredoxin [Maritimibacter sp. DP1N21-5]|uniref:ferredoxin n=1 Tax=Maritimibacter sp. DP1N21-5 TaxID=2836867 RepID=UPI001C479EC0|nr:ferredoxin [Maritimibacter sp. DP1N21-5]MBV7408151.1 ferredoxin [Maritimibacter sp. DP1N21-5]
MDHAAEARAVYLDLLAVAPEGERFVALLGPHEPGFWEAFQNSPEAADRAPDPMDRWSKRVIGALATQWGGSAVFPSDGPPYPPFIRWALGSGQVWQSPVGLLVHPRQGLWTSFRGAILLDHAPLLPELANPCLSCGDQPCLNACPVNALSATSYDTDACHELLSTENGADCLNMGCAARRACPVSTSYGRKADQSHFHMRAFHPA